MADQPETLVAFELVGEGLAPAFGEGEVIVAERGLACSPGARVIVELCDGSALFVRLLRQDRRRIVVAHLLTRAQSAIDAGGVAAVLRLKAMFSAGHAPRQGIHEWRRLTTNGGAR